jgi:hypothetical protein
LLVPAELQKHFERRLQLSMRSRLRVLGLLRTSLKDTWLSQGTLMEPRPSGNLTYMHSASVEQTNFNSAL